jgi:7,8-dihydropterin-6-yl-methyl-4-(beta-D-ribofuranosyl)aminobenzene 5'-phosphate synthase
MRTFLVATVIGMITIASSVRDSGLRFEAPALTMINVYDAFGYERVGLTYDFGFSTLVRYGNTTVLFDAGTDAGIFERNLAALGIDPREIDVAILSHGHHDHIGGFDYLLSVNPDVKLYLPNDFFSLGAPIRFPFREPDPQAGEQLPLEQRYFGGKQSIDGMITRSSGRFWKANVEYITEPKEILPGVTLIPTRSSLMGTFSKYPPAGEQPQLIEMPELSVSFTTERGEVLISGCSHSSIESITQAAKAAMGRKIHLVSGGFHLIPYERSFIEGLAVRMKEEYGVEAVAPAHCTGHTGFAVFRETFGDGYRFFGIGERIDV